MRSQPLLYRDIRGVLWRPTRVGGDIPIIVLWHAAAPSARVFVLERRRVRSARGRVVARFGLVSRACGFLAAGVLGLGVEVICASRAVARGRRSGVSMRRLHVGGLVS